MEKKENIIEEEAEMKSPVKKSAEEKNSEASENSNNKSNENLSSNTNNQTAKTVVNDANTEAKNCAEDVKESENDFILQNFMEENEININEVQSVKNMLLKLQKVLLTCDMNELQPEDLKLSAENELNSSNASNPSNLPYEEKIAILKSEIQQLEAYNIELKNELSQFKTDNLNKNGIQSGLKTRINEQNNTILEMKNEQLNLQLNAQNLSKEKDDLKNQLNSCQEQIHSLKNELENKDKLIEKFKNEIRDLTREKEEQSKIIRQQVKQVSDTLDVVQEKEHTLSGMIANTDRKINLIASHTSKKDVLVTASKEEYSIIKDSLGRLRHQFGHNHPSQVLINIIEQNFNSLIERTGLNPALFSSSTSGSSSLTSSSANSPVQHVQSQSPSSVHSSSSSISAVSNYSHKSIEKSENEAAKSESSNNESNVKKIISRLFAQTYSAPQGVHQNGNLSARAEKPNKLNNQMWENFCKQKSTSSLLTISTSTNFDSTQSSANTSTNSCNNSALLGTKCVYYLEKNNNPIVINLNKNLGSITLSDLKEAIKLKQSNYRFRFKLTDPEFGVIKQEVT